MTVDVEAGRHIPKNSMLFEFDDEVISVFDNMARRSIIGYDDAYRLISAMLSRAQLPRHTQIWDFGVTTGKGLLVAREGRNLDPYVDYFGCDISPDAVARTQTTCPFATIIQHDLNKGIPEAAQDISVAIFGYTLQFMEDRAARKRCIQEVYERMHPGALLFVLEKYSTDHAFMAELMQDTYIEFRRKNGYSLAEIKAKTAALANSMWPETPDFMHGAMLSAGFKDENIHVLYRQLAFGGFVAFR